MPFQNRQLDHSPADLLTIDEAAQRMNVETGEVEDMIQNNSLPSVTVGGERRVHVAQLDLYTSNQIGVAAALGSDEEVDVVPS